MYEQERERIAWLKTLAAQLERLPPSRARDVLLSEVRHRAVMLEIGAPLSSAWGDRPDGDAAQPFSTGRGSLIRRIACGRSSSPMTEADSYLQPPG